MWNSIPFPILSPFSTTPFIDKNFICFLNLNCHLNVNSYFFPWLEKMYHIYIKINISLSVDSKKNLLPSKNLKECSIIKKTWRPVPNRFTITFHNIFLLPYSVDTCLILPYASSFSKNQFSNILIIYRW